MFFFDAYSGLFCVGDDIHSLKKNNSLFVLSPDRKNIIELKDVAFTIWENIQKPITFVDLLKKVKSEYDVPEEELKKDLKDWLKEAISEKIVKKLKNN